MRSRPARLAAEALLVLGDAALVFASFAAAYWLRFSSGLVAAPKGTPPYSEYAPGTLVACALFFLAFRAHDLYRPRRALSALDETTTVLRAVVLGSLLTMAAAFLYRGMSYSRVAFLIAWGVASVLLPAGRLAYRALQRALHRRGVGLARVAIVGTGEMGALLAERIAAHPTLGYDLVGFIEEGKRGEDRDPEEGDSGDRVDGPRRRVTEGGTVEDGEGRVWEATGPAGGWREAGTPEGAQRAHAASVASAPATLRASTLRGAERQDPPAARIQGDERQDPPAARSRAAERDGLAPAPLLGSLDDVARLVETHALDRLLVALPFASHHRMLEVVAACDRLPVEILFVPDLFEVMTQRVRVTEIDGIPFLAIRAYPLEAWNRVVKRAFDIVVSAALLVVSSPVMAVVALLVRLDSRGPALYRQRRVGRDGRDFVMLKFRTMPVDVEAASGPVIGEASDPRATRLGRVLRRTCLDELPQFWNVLAGEMSLVGPRPERPVFVDRFDRAVPRYFARHRVKSGVTGWAQVNGLRGKTSIEERTKYDVYYVENWSLLFDLKILLLTARQVLFANRPRSGA